MNLSKLILGTLTLLASSSMCAFIGTAPVANATGNTATCLDPKLASSYQATIQRGTGTFTVKDGKPLCASQDIVFESFNVPSTWDKKGWNSTAIPQTKFASTLFTIPAGVANFTKTVTVATPEACKHTQLDFYFAPEYQSITTLTGDDERGLKGQLFAGTGECATTVEVKDIQVCETATYKVVTIKETAFDAAKYSKNTADCKKPVQKCTVPGKTHLPVDSNECVQTPVTVVTPVTPKPTPVAELPHTGIADLLSPILGAGTLTAAGYYYVTSRRIHL